MRLLRSSAALVILGVVACSDPAAPLSLSTQGPTNASLVGTWRTLPIPSGGSIVFSLDAAGPFVLGSGDEYGVRGVFQSPLTISGREASDGSFSLTVKSNDVTASYAGRLVDSTRIEGTWTSPIQQPATVVFLRQ